MSIENGDFLWGAEKDEETKKKEEEEKGKRKQDKVEEKNGKDEKVEVSMAEE